MQFPCIWRFGGHSPGLFSTRASPLRQFLIGYNQNQKPSRKWNQKLKLTSVSKKLRFVLVFLKQTLETGYSPNISTNPLQQWGFRNVYLSAGQHCKHWWHPIAIIEILIDFCFLAEKIRKETLKQVPSLVPNLFGLTVFLSALVAS